MIGLIASALFGVVVGAAAGEVVRKQKPELTRGIEAKTESKVRSAGAKLSAARAKVRRAGSIVGEGFAETATPKRQSASSGRSKAKK